MIPERIEEIRKKIARACLKAGRDPSEVILLAVSKTFPGGLVREVLEADVHDIGENYIQELLRKRNELPDPRIRWHFIGHLQSNKVRSIAGWIHLIHSVDSVKLAAEIDRQARNAGRVIDVLLEVNTTGEKSKFGIQPEETTAMVREMGNLSNISLGGLMTIGPFLPDPEGSRPMFARLRDLRDEVRKLPQSNVSMKHLSMGMTGDFEVAIEEGATVIRIGTAIFGPRTKREA